MALILFNAAKSATELGRSENGRQREEEEEVEEEEEEGECTLREVRPRFREPQPHTPQVL